MKYDIYVFDLDGTLLDSLEDLYLSVNYALGKYGFPLRTISEVRAFVGNGIVKLIERALPKDYSSTDFDKVFTAFKEYYGIHCKDNTKPYDGVKDLLKTLKQNDKKCAIVSNKADFATKILAKEHFEGLIDIAIGENEAEGIKKKPAPDSVFAVLKQLKTEENETAVYIGDSDVDLQTAKNSGLDCISVTWGFRDKEFLIKNGATVLVNDPFEILDI